MKKNTVSQISVVILAMMLLASCSSYNTEKKLNPDEQEFLSKVRFIITKQERKVFLRLPESERKAFIEEFWVKRDPDPLTEENEFKLEYSARIENANRLFRGEGIPGWLTDRGRILILFGPPYSRKQYPSETYGGIIRAREVWYYGNFPILFEDRNGNGVFRLISTNIAQLNEINYALRQVREDQEDQVQDATTQPLILDFSVELGESASIPVITVKIPYNKIWLNYKSEEDILETALNLNLRILGNDQEIIFEHEEDYTVSLTEEALQDKRYKDHVIEVPVILTQGEYVVQAILTNTTGGSKAYKEIKIQVQ